MSKRQVDINKKIFGGNCGRVGYTKDCDGVFSKRKNGKRYKYCDDCRKDMRKHDSSSVREEYHKKDFNVPAKSIYALLDENRTIVYIGESIRTSKRLSEHLAGYKGRSSVAGFVNELWSYIILWDGTSESKQDRLLKEAVLIQVLKPKYNKQWNQED